jgi:PAS domain S-box-containing protein
MAAQIMDAGPVLDREILDRVRKLAQAATQAEVSDLPVVLDQMVEAIYDAADLQGGAVVLFDSSFNEGSILEDRSAGVLHRRVSGAGDQALATAFLRSLPDSLAWEACRLHGPHWTSVVRVPLAVGSKSAGVLWLIAKDGILDLNDATRCMLDTLACLAAVVLERRHHERENALVAAFPRALVTVDIAGTIITFNEEAAALFEYPKGSLAKVRVAGLYWGGLAAARKVQQLLNRDGRVRSQEVFGRSQSGERIPINLSAALVKDGRGQVIGLTGPGLRCPRRTSLASSAPSFHL